LDVRGRRAQRAERDWREAGWEVVRSWLVATLATGDGQYICHMRRWERGMHSQAAVAPVVGPFLSIQGRYVLGIGHICGGHAGDRRRAGAKGWLDLGENMLRERAAQRARIAKVALHGRWQLMLLPGAPE